MGAQFLHTDVTQGTSNLGQHTRDTSLKRLLGVTSSLVDELAFLRELNETQSLGVGSGDLLILHGTESFAGSNICDTDGKASIRCYALKSAHGQDGCLLEEHSLK